MLEGQKGTGGTIGDNAITSLFIVQS